MKNKTIKQVHHFLSQDIYLMNGEFPLLKFSYNDIQANPWLEKITWLTVKYKNVLGYSQEDGVEYEHLLSLEVKPSMDANKLLLRIITQLADKLKSTQQDLNIINKLIK